ncbi:MAG: hypothetical protein K6F94_00470, partial [Bacteroidaceae bacterium]|nr:hypothetical protein [Bacteroidaceae bacterium]
SHSILRGEQTTDRTNFLTSGDTYERIQYDSRDKNLTLSTNHTLDYTCKLIPRRGIIGGLLGAYFRQRRKP